MKPKPLQWEYEGSCIRCTSHGATKGYPMAQRYGRYKTIARHFLLRRNRMRLPTSVVSRHTCDNRWCINPDHVVSGTLADNNRDRTERGRNGDNRGEKHGKCKLANADILAIRALALPQRQIANLFGVSQRLIWAIKHGRTWKHL